MDEFDTEAPATSKKNFLDKLVEKNRPLKAAPVGVLKPSENSTAEERSAAQTKVLQSVQQSESTSTYQDIHDAYAATVGGVARDLYRAANVEQGLQGVDPNFDVGEFRENFRRTYPMEFWDSLEQVKNQSQYSHLIYNLDERLKRQDTIGKSTTGSLLGSFTDPTAALGGILFKGGAKAAQTYNLGKAKTIATTAALEGSVYGGTEAALQNAETGEVYDPMAAVRTFGIGAAMHYGVGVATSSKAEFMSTKAIDAALPSELRAAQNLDNEAAVAGDTLVREARQALADKAQTVVQDIDAGKITANDLAMQFDRHFPMSAYPSPEIQAAKVEAIDQADSALVDAGSAANTGRAEALATPIIKSESQAIQDAIDTFTSSDKAVREMLSSQALNFFDTPMGKLSKVFSNTMQGFASESPIVREAARLLGADSTGVFRNVERATAYDKTRYNKLMRHHYASVNDEYKAWAKRNGNSGLYAELSTSLEVKFNKELRDEMEARWNSKDESPEAIKLIDEERWRSVPPEVKRAADALDKGNQVALDLMKEHNVLGAEGLSDISRGYIPRRMDGKALQNLHRESPEMYSTLKDALGKRYHESFNAQRNALIEDIKADVSMPLEQRTAELEKIRPISLEKATTIAEGVMKRAIDRASGIDGSTIGLFDKAARNEIESILKSKGMDYSDIEHTFALMDKKLSMRTGSNRLKGRMEVDISTPDEATGMRFLDYFDNDLNRLSTSYAEEMSGRISLARQGISSDNDFENIIAAVRNENKSADVEADIKLLRDMHSVLLGRPIKGQGESKFVQLMTQMNPLQALGQVGVAQLAETSLAVAQLGVGVVFKAAPMAAKLVTGARKNMVKSNDLILLRDVEALNGPIGESWRIHRPSTEVLERLNADGAIAHMVDKMLKFGQHVNGYVSFMHQVMEVQLKSIAVMGTRHFASEIKSGVLTKRLADVGFTESSVASIKRTLDAHAIYKDGELYDLNLAQWRPDDAEHFMRNIERMSGQLIQQDFAGEAASWMHRDTGRMFLSLRGYSAKAFNKQLVRNVKLGDAIAAQAVMYGMFFSTLGYTAKMYLASQFREDQDEFLEQRLSGAALAQGALSYMSFSTFVPELLRPMASWYSEGEDAGAMRSGGNAVVAAIPGLAPIDRAAKLIGNAGSSIVGGKEYKAAHARQAITTLFGNSFPVTLAINAMVDDDE